MRNQIALGVARGKFRESVLAPQCVDGCQARIMEPADLVGLSWTTASPPVAGEDSKHMAVKS